MIIFKKYTIISGKPRWIIVDEFGKIINNEPTKGELRDVEIEAYTGKYRCNKQTYTKAQLLKDMIKFYEENKRIPKYRDFRNNNRYQSPDIYTKVFGSWNNAIKEAGLWEKRYNSTHSCDRCGESFKEISWGPSREYDEKGAWTGRWDCSDCLEKYDPNSYSNTKKRLRNCRTGNQNPNHPGTKGYIGEELTNRWRGTKNLNKENDNYNFPIDHSIDPELGVIQTKTAWYSPKNRCWSQGFENEFSKCFNYLILHCISEDGRNVERIYIIPEKEVKSTKGIKVVKYDASGLLYEIGWYEKYRLKDEEELKKINVIWKNLQR